MASHDSYTGVEYQQVRDTSFKYFTHMKKPDMRSGNVNKALCLLVLLICVFYSVSVLATAQDGSQRPSQVCVEFRGLRESYWSQTVTVVDLLPEQSNSMQFLWPERALYALIEGQWIKIEKSDYAWERKPCSPPWREHRVRLRKAN